MAISILISSLHQAAADAMIRMRRITTGTFRRAIVRTTLLLPTGSIASQAAYRSHWRPEAVPPFHAAAKISLIFRPSQDISHHFFLRFFSPGMPRAIMIAVYYIILLYQLISLFLSAHIISLFLSPSTMSAPCRKVPPSVVVSHHADAGIGRAVIPNISTLITPRYYGHSRLFYRY